MEFSADRILIIVLAYVFVGLVGLVVEERQRPHVAPAAIGLHAFGRQQGREDNRFVRRTEQRASEDRKLLIAVIVKGLPSRLIGAADDKCAGDHSEESHTSGPKQEGPSAHL